MSILRRLVQVFRPGQARPAKLARLAQYNTYEAKNIFSELLERVRTGEEIVVARSGHPVAKLVPYAGEEVRPGVYRAHVYVHDERTEMRPVRAAADSDGQKYAMSSSSDPSGSRK